MHIALARESKCNAKTYKTRNFYQKLLITPIQQYMQKLTCAQQENSTADDLYDISSDEVSAQGLHSQAFSSPLMLKNDIRKFNTVTEQYV
jgi:hypothetical protein